jgi:hypothetical protein
MSGGLNAFVLRRLLSEAMLCSGSNNWPWWYHTLPPDAHEHRAQCGVPRARARVGDTVKAAVLEYWLCGWDTRVEEMR